MESGKLLNILQAMLDLDRNVTSTVQDVHRVIGQFPMIALNGEKDPYDALTGQDHLEVEALRGALDAYEVNTSLSWRCQMLTITGRCRRNARQAVVAVGQGCHQNRPAATSLHDRCRE